MYCAITLDNVLKFYRGCSDYGSLIWKTLNECHSVDCQDNNVVIYGNGCVRPCSVRALNITAAFSGLTRILSGTYLYNKRQIFLVPLHPRMHRAALLDGSVFARQPRRFASHCSGAFHVLSNLQERRSVSASSPRLDSEKILTNILSLLAHAVRAFLGPPVRSRYSNLQCAYVDVLIGSNSRPSRFVLFSDWRTDMALYLFS